MLGYGGAVTLLIAFAYIILRAVLDKLCRYSRCRTSRDSCDPRGQHAGRRAVLIGLLSRTALLGGFQSRRPEIARMFVFGGQGALIGLAGAAGYMVLFEVLQLGDMFSRHETNYRAFDIGFFAGLRA